MEMIKVEIAALEEANRLGADTEVRELCDLQLALIGGGTGDVHLA